MGKKKAPADDAEEAPAPEEKKEEKKEEEKVVKDEGEDDPPIVVELKKVDDEYLRIEREYEKACAELQKKYQARQNPLLDQRAKLLTSTDGVEEEAAKLGTPALKGFWLQAMKHHPALEHQIEEWDEPVLEYLSDIKRAHLDADDEKKGFKLVFSFAENPYFTNSELWKEFYTEETSPYTSEIDTKEIKVSEIDWSAGKNVTVETIKKKAKGGGAKKAKQKGKEKEEPRDSFFRNVFRHLTPDMPVPEDAPRDDDYDEEDDEDMIDMLMENDYEIGCAIKEQLIPYAVRWYTGEAAPDDYSDDEDEDDEEDEDDDDDDDEDDDDDDDEPQPRRKAGGKPRRDGGGGGGGGKSAGGPGGGGEEQKECKQQ